MPLQVNNFILSYLHVDLVCKDLIKRCMYYCMFPQPDYRLVMRTDESKSCAQRCTMQDCAMVGSENPFFPPHRKCSLTGILNIV